MYGSGGRATEVLAVAFLDADLQQDGPALVANLGEGGIPGGKNAYDLTIIAEYREENYLKVQRNLNRAIKELFTKEGINYF